MKLVRSASFGPALALSLPSLFVAAAPDPPRSANDALYQAIQLLNAGAPEEARDAFEQANALAGGRCFTCLEGIAAANLRMGQTNEAVAAARKALGTASTDEEKARGHNQLGLALGARAGEDRQALAGAEAEYRKALAASGKLNSARFNLATVLLRSGRRKEGLAELKEFLRQEPEGPRAAQARTLARSPHRAGEVMAPDFAVETLSGAKLTLGGLAGKVVLMDFWATWCGPCRLALPELQSLKRQMAGEPFEVVSASADKYLSTLKEFVEKNAMTWPQFWDQKGELARDFSVAAYPSYYLVDPDGVIVYTARGWSRAQGDEIAERVRQEVRKAKEKRRAPKAAGGGWESRRYVGELPCRHVDARSRRVSFSK